MKVLFRVDVVDKDVQIGFSGVQGFVYKTSILHRGYVAEERSQMLSL